MRQDLDLNLLVTFVAVSEAGSFTGAAQQLGLQRSKVSRQIAALERTMAVRLIERTTQRMRLTEAGHAFYERCRAALGEIDFARGEASELSDTPRGELVLCAPLDLGAWLCEALMPEFLRAYPNIRVRFSLTYRYQDLLQEGIDAALRIGRHADDTHIAQRVGAFERGLFASPEYLAACGRPTRPEQLAAHACLPMSVGAQPTRWTLNAGPREVSLDIDATFKSDNFRALRNMALAGAGITALPTLFFAEDIQAGRLVRVLPRWRLGDAEIHLVYPSRRFKPAKLVVFAEFLRSHRALVGPATQVT